MSSGDTTVVTPPVPHTEEKIPKFGGVGTTTGCRVSASSTEVTV